jgi:hypothetical protein
LDGRTPNGRRPGRDRRERIRRFQARRGPGARKGPGTAASAAAELKRGLAQPGGKLPLFDEVGQHYDPRTVRACLDKGWAAPWIGNPLKPDWLVCKLTEAGRSAVS